MYTLLIKDDDSVTTSKSETIMQRSGYVDNIQVLVRNMYKGTDLSDATIWMKYKMPKSNRLKMTQLVLSNDNYNNSGYSQYIVPCDPDFTSEAGNIEVTFTFIKLDSVLKNAYTRKTQTGYIKITPIAEWEDFVVDDMLNEMDQRLIMIEARQKDLEALNQELFDNMVNDVRLDTDNSKIVLTNNSGDVGNGIDTNELSDMITNKIVGYDADGVQDGVVHLDNVPQGYNVINLDKLI